MIKLIATDIDGTLVGARRDISPKNEQAIQKAIKQGVHFAIASGRAYDDIIPISQKHHLECQIIAINGGEYYDEKGQLLAHYHLDKQAALKVCRICKEKGLHYMLYTTKGTVTEMDVSKVKDMFIHRKIACSGGNYKDTYEDMEKNYSPFRTLKHIDNLSLFLEDKNVSVLKVEGFDEFEKLVSEVKDSIKNIEDITYLSSFYNNIEVTNINAKKGDILLKVIKQMNILPEEVMVLGDGANDMSMFELFENSVAVDNAIDEIREKAKYIVSSVDDDGVAEAIEKYVLK